MKKNNWYLLINPFTQIAGWKAFAIGLLVVALTVLIGYFNHICFPGLISVKYTSGLTLANAMLYQAIGLIPTILLVYTAGLIFGKGIRFQDILGTVTFSRTPYLFVALLGFMVGDVSDSELMDSLFNGTFEFANYAGLFLFGLVSMVFSIWVIALLYNAFRVSTDIKGPKAIILFIAIVIFSEILSLLILYLL